MSIRKFSAFFTLALCVRSLFAGIEISTDHKNAMYRCGETAAFTIKVTDTNGLVKAGAVSIVLDNFGPGVIASNDFQLATSNPIVIKGKRDEPGFLRLTVKDGKKSVAWSVGYEPEKIRAVTQVPDDFDAFWSNAKKKLAAEVPLDPQMTKVPERCTKAFDFYRISFATSGRRVHGYMSIPTNAKLAPFPVEIQVAAAGFGNWTNDMKGEADRIRVFFSVYPFEPHWKWKELGLEAKYKEQDKALDAQYGCGRYCNAGSGVSRETYFYYPVILGIDRAIDWLAARPDVDPKRIRYQGTSQGGGMGLALTALNKHISRAAFFVPAMTDTLAGQAGRQSGWPQPVESQSTPEAKAMAAKVMPYYDGAVFATRITCPVRFAVGLADNTCPPHCTWAAYNATASKDKKIVYGIGMGHGCRGDFYKGLGVWLAGKPNAGPLAVTLTFDDDAREFATVASPLLVKYGWKGIFNVITERVGSDATQLTWDDVRAIRDTGHEIASHSVSHPHLKTLMAEGNTNEVRRQIFESRDVLARELGRPPVWFCFPYNWGDARVQAIVKEAGMRSFTHKRPNFGARRPSWTDAGAYVYLLDNLADGARHVDIMVHGVCRGRGFRPFDDGAQYEEHLKELKALEAEGFIRVLPYSEAYKAEDPK